MENWWEMVLFFRFFVFFSLLSPCVKDVWRWRPADWAEEVDWMFRGCQGGAFRGVAQRLRHVFGGRPLYGTGCTHSITASQFSSSPLTLTRDLSSLKSHSISVLALVDHVLKRASICSLCSSAALQLNDGVIVFSLQNRLQESMKLFSSICNNVFFRSTSMVRNSSIAKSQ